MSKEKGGISGAWTQLMDPLPQRGETNMARGEKLGEVLAYEGSTLAVKNFNDAS